MKLSVTSAARKDGKYKVTIFFPGSPNMFGGNYPGRSFNKLYTAAQIIDALKGADDDYKIPAEIKALIQSV